MAVAVPIAAILVDAWRQASLRRVAAKTGSEALAADALHFSSNPVNSALSLVAFALVARGYRQACPRGHRRFAVNRDGRLSPDAPYNRHADGCGARGCRVAPACDVAIVLAQVDRNEHLLMARMPDIRRVVGHAEPRLRHKPGVDREPHVGC